MINIKSVRVHEKTCMGVRIDLPDSPPLLVMIADKGFVMCGFLNIDAAESLGVAAAVVSGVRDFDEVLDAEVKAVTSKAETLDVHKGMKGEDALDHMLHAHG